MGMIVVVVVQGTEIGGMNRKRIGRQEERRNDG